MITGRVLNIQNYSVNDGEGIRTLMFLAGCPLRCKWCANPEGLVSRNQIFYNETLCTHCGRCAAACPNGVGVDLNDPRNRARCLGCGKCAAVCPMKARKNTVMVMTPEEAVEKLMAHQIFFDYSGGGVTYSGGECTVQRDFLNAVTARMYDEGISQAMESSAYFDFDQVRPILERMDHIFMDIKCMNSGLHQLYTGRRNERILENIQKTAALGIPMTIRIPLIRHVNDSLANVRATAAFVHQVLPRPEMEILPNHFYGLEKYRQLGMDVGAATFETPDSYEVNRFVSVIQDEGVAYVSYR